MSTRLGGLSAPPFDSLNVGEAVGDDPRAVAGNRRLVASVLQAEPVWLRQVHGSRVVRVGRIDAGGAAPEADDPYRMFQELLLEEQEEPIVPPGGVQPTPGRRRRSRASR